MFLNPQTTHIRFSNNIVSFSVLWHISLNQTRIDQPWLLNCPPCTNFPSISSLWQYKYHGIPHWRILPFLLQFKDQNMYPHNWVYEHRPYLTVNIASHTFRQILNHFILLYYMAVTQLIFSWYFHDRMLLICKWCCSGISSKVDHEVRR